MSGQTHFPLPSYLLLSHFQLLLNALSHSGKRNSEKLIECSINGNVAWRLAELREVSSQQQCSIGLHRSRTFCQFWIVLKLDNRNLRKSRFRNVVRDQRPETHGDSLQSIVLKEICCCIVQIGGHLVSKSRIPRKRNQLHRSFGQNHIDQPSVHRSVRRRS